MLEVLGLSLVILFLGEHHSKAEVGKGTHFRYHSARRH